MISEPSLKISDSDRPLLIRLTDNLFVTFVGIISLGYCLFGNRFAESNIQLPFLDFPIFIGEILLFISFGLAFVKWQISGQRLRTSHYFILTYIVFVFLKTVYGYLKWGPLALRHSALFYYPLFAVLGYFFFRREYFSRKKTILLAILLIFILLADTRLFQIIEYNRVIYFILAFLLILQHPDRRIRFFLFVSLFLCTPYRLLFRGGRTMMVSNITSVFFLIAMTPFVVKIKKSILAGLTVFILIVLYFGLIKLSDRNSLRSISNLQENIKEYNEFMTTIAIREPFFKMKPVKQTKIYNKEVGEIKLTEEIKLNKEELPQKIVQLAELESELEKIKRKIEEKQIDFYSFPQAASLDGKKEGSPVIKINQPLPQAVSTMTHEQKIAKELLVFRAEMKELLNKEEEVTLLHGKLKYQLKQLERNEFPKENYRDLDTVYTNSSFRIFIWQDMFADLRLEKPVFGFDFGKPFRSKKIEILDIAHGEWTRDGWIAAHNSYLEIIYRSGIVGILLILTMFSLFLRMVSVSIKYQSIYGLLLCGALLSWLTAANFMLIFELPYHAIPFWSLFGMSLAFVKEYHIVST